MWRDGRLTFFLHLSKNNSLEVEKHTHIQSTRCYSPFLSSMWDKDRKELRVAKEGGNFSEGFTKKIDLVNILLTSGQKRPREDEEEEREKKSAPISHSLFITKKNHTGTLPIKMNSRMKQEIMVDIEKTVETNKKKSNLQNW